MNPTSISVVIPVHNMAKYLFRCVCSAIWQLETDDELIIVDDGSTDLDGNAGLDPFWDRIRLLRNHECRGVSYSRNRGIRESRAAWIKFLDADDVLAPFALTCIKNARPPIPAEVHVVTGGCDRMCNGRYDNFLCGARESLKQILVANPILPSATFVRREAALAVGMFDERIDFEQDWDFWLRLHEKYGLETFRVTDQPLCYYWYSKSEREQKVRTKLVDGVPVREYFRTRYGADPCP